MFTYSGHMSFLKRPFVINVGKSDRLWVRHAVPACTSEQSYPAPVTIHFKEQ